MANILIVEDNHEVAELFQIILEEAGNKVERAATAYEAVLLAAKLSFDIVLMDLILFGANGVVAALALRGLGVEAPIIAISGNLITIDEAIYDRVGFAAKILKPVRSKELIDEINNHLKTVI